MWPLPHYDDEEFDLMLRRLNALNPQWDGWQETKARKQHTDKFGATIQPDEVYYKRSLSAAWGNVLKLSRASMDRLLFVLFGSNPGLETLADDIAEGRQRLYTEQARAHSVVDAWELGEED